MAFFRVSWPKIKIDTLRILLIIYLSRFYHGDTLNIHSVNNIHFAFIVEFYFFMALYWTISRTGTAEDNYVLSQETVT